VTPIIPRIASNVIPQSHTLARVCTRRSSCSLGTRRGVGLTCTPDEVKRAALDQWLSPRRCGVGI
jgi:hypothetical protein